MLKIGIGRNRGFGVPKFSNIMFQDLVIFYYFDVGLFVKLQVFLTFYSVESLKKKRKKSQEIVKLSDK